MPGSANEFLHDGSPNAPPDRSQAIVEAPRQVGAVLRRAAIKFALAGSVAMPPVLGRLPPDHRRLPPVR